MTIDLTASEAELLRAVTVKAAQQALVEHDMHDADILDDILGKLTTAIYNNERN